MKISTGAVGNARSRVVADDSTKKRVIEKRKIAMGENHNREFREPGGEGVTATAGPPPGSQFKINKGRQKKKRSYMWEGANYGRTSEHVSLLTKLTREDREKKKTRKNRLR